jgi:hypothetical protein
MAKNMDRAIRENLCGEDSTSQVRRITSSNCDDASLIMHVADGVYYSWQEREDWESAANVWRNLGFEVKPLHI